MVCVREERENNCEWKYFVLFTEVKNEAYCEARGVSQQASEKAKQRAGAGTVGVRLVKVILELRFNFPAR